MASWNTSGCWPITSSVVTTGTLICPLAGMQLILIPNLGKSIANPLHSIIAACCFRNGIPIRVSYFPRFPARILLPLVSSFPTVRLTVHPLLLSDRDPFMAMSILVGSFNSMHGIPWVVTKAALIRFAPIVDISHRTFASVLLMNRVPSIAWCPLIVVGRVVFVAT